MKEAHCIFFIYGMCFMFYSMMAWLFWRKHERLSRFVMALMLLIALQCLKDLFFLDGYLYSDMRVWTNMTSVDMVAVPLYAFILMELCRPGMVTKKMIAAQLLPVIVLPFLYITTGHEVFYFMELGYVMIYGVGYAIWTIFAIRRYNMLLHRQFSYEENINLNWMRGILVFFFVILSLWVVDCLYIHIELESLYMLGSLGLWIFLAYFIYRHKSVVEELNGCKNNTVPESEKTPDSVLHTRICRLFREQKVFLDPNLKLADIAAMTGSNRTYISRYFNEEVGTSFFDYVNRYRVDYAMQLLAESDEKLDVIAEKSGFNFRQSLHRVFSSFEGVTPERYRKGCRKP